MLNIPNILSLFRLCLVPIFVMMYFSGLENSRIYAALIYILATVTDFLDGYIARKYDLITNLGKVLDPLGDKMITFAVLYCLTIDKVLPIFIIIIFFMKEAMMGLGGLLLHRRAKAEIPSSNILGKSATVLFFVFCAMLIVFDNIPPQVGTIMVTVALVLSCFALISYSITFVRLMRSQGKDHLN